MKLGLFIFVVLMEIKFSMRLYTDMRCTQSVFQCCTIVEIQDIILQKFLCLQIVDWPKLVRAKVPQLCDPKIQNSTYYDARNYDWGVLQFRNLQKQFY